MHIKRDILATLVYFDLFDYPLTQAEIFAYLRSHCSYEVFCKMLYELTSENRVIRFDDLYTLQDDYALILRRREGNLKAGKMLVTAKKIAAFLSCFPFVRGVAVSGSLSKNFADENSDIDFFIVTAKNRLWLARSIMHLCKKISFLFNKQDWFCMNYYVDEEGLEIKEKNIFTATELATLKPFRGTRAFDHFYSRNNWYTNFFPNHRLKVSYLEETKQPFLKMVIEGLLNNKLGDFLDSRLMKLTDHRWKLKTKNKKLNKRGCVLSLEANKHYAKPHPEGFQNKLIALYEKKLYFFIRNYDNQIKSFY